MAEDFFEIPQGKAVAVGKYTFEVRGEDWTDNAAAAAWGAREGIDLGTMSQTENYILGQMILIRRIVGWNVKDKEGKPVPCTTQNKMAFFGKNGALVGEYAIELNKLEGLEIKNSKTSQGGEETPNG